jgi:hypothetical protein
MSLLRIKRPFRLARNFQPAFFFARPGACKKAGANLKKTDQEIPMTKLLLALTAAFLSQSLCAAPEAPLQKYEKAVHDAAMPELGRLAAAMVLRNVLPQSA